MTCNTNTAHVSDIRKGEKIIKKIFQRVNAANLLSKNEIAPSEEWHDWNDYSDWDRWDDGSPPVKSLEF